LDSGMNVLIYFNWPVEFWNVPDSHVEILRSRFPDITFTHTSDETEATKAAATADVIFTSRISPSALRDAAHLKWIQSSASSVSTLPLNELAAGKVVVTNTRTLQGGPIAEHVMGGILVLARRYDLTLAAQREARWIQNEMAADATPWCLEGKAMTILGMGSIGQETARRARAFGMNITAVRRRPGRPKPPFVDQVYGPDQLPIALRGCDVLVIAAPFLAATDRLVGSTEISLMNRGALIVNVARGKIVDEAAMISALNSGQLGGAVLDVFHHEPLDPSSPLWTLPNVVVTPHIASLRPDHWDDVVELFSDNLRRFMRGQPLRNLVDLAAGY
jgi:phosphoglycerate dehydrogenase-like enzyme